MRYLKNLLTGWCLIIYLQSACLPLDLILSGLRLTEKRQICRCKITGMHSEGCRCPCCVGPQHEVAAHTDDRASCHIKETTSVSGCRIVPAGCGSQDSFTVDSPRLSLYLVEESIGLEVLASARPLVDRRITHPYSVFSNLPDKIPI